MARLFRLAGALTLLALTSPFALSAQSADRPVSAYPAQTSFPKEDRAVVSRHLAAARRIAGDDLWSEMRWHCLVSPLDRDYVQGAQHDGLVPATKVFDQLYAVGQNAVSAWAIDTNDGIILIDALNSPDEARDILVPNLVAMGLDPKRIRTVIITHGHGDHYGGAKYLQDTYAARIAASAADWEMMAGAADKPGPFRNLVPPRRDMAVADGDTITLGKTSVRLSVTPGHTPGTLSLTFPVTLNGKPHMVGLMGGTGGGSNPAAIRQQIASLARWQSITRAATVDAMITNHPAHMDATEKQVLLRYAATGGVNPFVTGGPKYQRYMQVMAECSKVQLARLGEKTD